jgi:hypothetical protein
VQPGTQWMLLASGVSTFLSLAVQIALLVVSLTVVRRRNPAAATLLGAAFGIGVGSTVLYPVVNAAIPALVGAQYRYMAMYSAITVGFALVHMVSGVLLALGLVKLSTP